MRRLFALALAAILLFSALPRTTVQADGLPKVDLTMWSKEDDATNKSLGVQKLFDDWAAKNAPGSTLTIVNKSVEDLRTQFQSAALAGSGGPDVMWTVADHAGPFTAAGLIQPVDNIIDAKTFIPTIVNITKIDGKIYGVPLSAGNHLMMYYNKSLVPTPPATMDDLVKLAKDLQTKNASVDKFTPFAYNQQESFWVFPFAHGFGATEFAADNKTPVLDSKGWTQTYQLLYDLKFTNKIEPTECDYNCADGLFKGGQAAIILNGDWALGGDTGYVKLLGKNLGIAPFPKVAGGGQPSPFVAGVYMMIPNSTKGDKLTVLSAWIKYLTSDNEAILAYTVSAGRLPAVQAALKLDAVTKNPVLADSSKALVTGIAQPVQPEMRCVFDAVTTSIRGVMTSQMQPADAATAAQKSAVDCIKTLK